MSTYILGTKSIVDDSLNNYQENPQITALENGDFAISWQSNRLKGSRYGVSTKVYSFNKTPVINEILEQKTDNATSITIPFNVIGEDKIITTVSATNGKAQIQKEGIIFTPNSTFVGTAIVTLSVDNGNGDFTTQDISVKVSQSNEVPKIELEIGDILVNSFTKDSKLHPEITTLNNDTFVITWQSASQRTNVGDEVYNVYGKVFNTNGTEVSSEFLINETTIDGEWNQEIISLENGGFVVAWHYGHDYELNDIYARVFNANGTAASNEFIVNDMTNLVQGSQKLTALPNGGFVITWHCEGQIGSDYAVVAKVYNADGTEKSSEFIVNESTHSYQSSPEITALTNGDFVIVWNSSKIHTYNGASGFFRDIKGKIFNADGNEVSRELLINKNIQGDHGEQQVVALNNGGFVVVWKSLNLSDSSFDTYGKVFNADGSEVSFTFIINENTSNQDIPQIIALNSGGFVVTWCSLGEDGFKTVVAKVYDGKGNKVRDEFIVNEYSTSDQEYQQITALENGSFVITWQSYGVDTSSGYGSFAKIFNSDGTEVSEEFVINDYNYTTQSFSQITALESGGFVAIWNSFNQDGLGNDIVAKIFDKNGSVVSALNQDKVLYIPFSISNMNDETTTITVNATNGSAKIIDEEIVFHPDSNFSGLAMVTITADDGKGKVITKDINVDVLGLNERAIIDEIYVADRDNEMLMNIPFTLTDNCQEEAQITALTSGGFVVSWHVNEDDGSLDHRIYAKVYSEDGTQITEEFIVNSYMNKSQVNSQIIALENGGFVVTWDSSSNICAKIYNADGTKVTGEFVVDSYISQSFLPQIIALNNGGFVITWQSYDDDLASGIFAKVYNANGTEVTEEFVVNEYSDTRQYHQQITALNNGGFVIVWQSDGIDNLSHEVSVKVYNANGTEVLDELVVNDYSFSSQEYTQITALNNGNFVATYDSSIYDSETRLSSKIYNVNGIQISKEIILNDYIDSGQYQTQIIPLKNAGFVVSWYSSGVDGLGYRVFAKIYNPDGTQATKEFVVNDYIDDFQSNTQITALENGGFVATWHTNEVDGSGHGVCGKIFDKNGNEVIQIFDIDADITTVSTTNDKSEMNKDDTLFLDLLDEVTKSSEELEGNTQWYDIDDNRVKQGIYVAKTSTDETVTFLVNGLNVDDI